VPIEDQQQHVALPRLYGASPTARPAPVAKEAPRPFNPDEMPVVAELTEDERDLIEKLPPEAFRPGGGYILGSDDGIRDEGAERRRMPSFLRALTGRLFGSS
jgi:hypothetical protein